MLQKNENKSVLST